MADVVAFPGIKVRAFQRPHRGGGKSEYLQALRMQIMRIGGAVIVVTRDGRVERHSIQDSALVIEDITSTRLVGHRVVSTPTMARGNFVWTDDWSV